MLSRLFVAAARRGTVAHNGLATVVDEEAAEACKDKRQN